MFSNSAANSDSRPKPQFQIFSLDWIKNSSMPFKLPDGRVTGYGLLKPDQWLLRSSSALGALTVDLHFKTENGQPNGIFNSTRYLLTTEGWVKDEGGAQEINADPNTALQYAEQLFQLLDSETYLQGLTQLFPDEKQMEKKTFYSAYSFLPKIIEPTIPSVSLKLRLGG